MFRDPLFIAVHRVLTVTGSQKNRVIVLFDICAVAFKTRKRIICVLTLVQANVSVDFLEICKEIV